MQMHSGGDLPMYTIGSQAEGFPNVPDALKWRPSGPLKRSYCMTSWAGSSAFAHACFFSMCNRNPCNLYSSKQRGHHSDDHHHNPTHICTTQSCCVWHPLPLSTAMVDVTAPLCNSCSPYRPSPAAAARDSRPSLAATTQHMPCRAYGLC